MDIECNQYYSKSRLHKSTVNHATFYQAPLGQLYKDIYVINSL